MNQTIKILLLTIIGLCINAGALKAQNDAEKDAAQRMKRLKLIYGNTSFKMDYTPGEIQKANTEVLAIRNKPLVVRLRTNKRQIEAYREAGNTALADKIELKTQKTNLNIISACIRLYTYSSVYFLDVDDKQRFIATDSLVFSHLLFEKDTVVYLPHDSVYYLDFGMLFGRAETNEWKYKEYGNSTEGSNAIAESAFVIRDAQDNQLVPPTPSSTIVFMQGGKKAKESVSYLNDEVDLSGPNSNSIIRSDFQHSNEFDAAINRMNARLFRCYAYLSNHMELENNPKLWFENNPNKYLYPLWINVEKKLLSIQEKAGGQFIKKN